jgi:hypothetical protein
VSLVRWVCFHEDNIVAVSLIIIVFWCKSSVLPLLVWSLLSLTCIAHIKGRRGCSGEASQRAIRKRPTVTRKHPFRLGTFFWRASQAILYNFICNWPNNDYHYYHQRQQ